MGRWVPDAQGRLIAAAVDLYEERGFEQTTVAEIAKRAGLTERTFFRYFRDKREVLFWGAELLEREIVREIESAPSALPAIDAVRAGIEALAALLPERSEYSRRRQAIIAANPELQERERIKLAAMASVAAKALRERGTGDVAAAMAAEMGVAVFRIAFERWIEPSNRETLQSLIRTSFEELKAVSAGR